MIKKNHSNKQLFKACKNNFLLFTLIVSISSCANFEPKQVKSWERGTLARENMQQNPNELQQLLDDHIYFSKESASGGGSIGGGGCGCN